MPTVPEYEDLLWERLASFPVATRAALLRILVLPDSDREASIWELHGYPETRALANLLIDIEKDRATRALVIGILRELIHRQVDSP